MTSTTTYTPLGSFKIMPLRLVLGPAIAMRVGNQRDLLLVTGGTPSMAIRVAGDNEGSAFEIVNAGNAEVFVFSDVSFEIDLTSTYTPALVDQPLGALIVKANGIHILATMRSGIGFDDAKLHPLAITLPVGLSTATETGFSRWRAVQRRDGEAVELLAYVSKKLGSY